MGICTGIIVCEAHESWEVELEESVPEENDAADGVARQNLRMTGKTHRAPKICLIIAPPVQQTKDHMGIYKE